MKDQSITLENELNKIFDKYGKNHRHSYVIKTPNEINHNTLSDELKNIITTLSIDK